MKKVLAFGLVISCSTFLLAWGPPDSTQGFSGNSKQVSVSTNTASPSLLLDREPNVWGNYIVNNTTYTIFLSSVSTNISTLTSPFIPAAYVVSGATMSYTFSPDGTNSPYMGQLFGATTGQTPPKISILRIK